MEHRYKRLLNNSVIFTIGNFGSKLMQFIMIPIYSYTLNTDEFGKVDFITTLVSLLASLVCLDIQDAVFRFALDKNEDKNKVFSTGIIFTTYSSAVLLIIGLIINPFIKGYPTMLIVLLLIANLYYGLILNFVRAVGFVKPFAVAGIINTFVMGILDIILLIVFHYGVKGYLWAMIIGMLIACIYLFIVTRLWEYTSTNNWNGRLFNRLTRYSLPLIPNTFSWWLNSASDRFFIVLLIGASANGIYAMANRIPNMLSVLTGIFFQSWQMSAVEEFGKKDSKKFITNVLNYFISLMFVGGILILAFIRPIFSLLLSHSYFRGWHLAPILILVVIYSSLAGFIGTLYTASKKTIIIFYTTFIGAFINVALTLILLKIIGISGAAIANGISFATVAILRFNDMKKNGKVDLNLGKLIFLHLEYLILCCSVFIISNDYIVALIGLIIVLAQYIFDPELKEVVRFAHSKLKILTKKISFR